MLEARGPWLVVQPERGTLAVTGPDRQTWLNGVVTADVAGLAPGEGRYALALQKTGKIQADLLVLPTEQELLLSVSPGRAAALVEALDRLLVMEDAELELREGDIWAELIGEGALELARGLGAPVRVASLRRTQAEGALLAIPAAQLTQVVARLCERGARQASGAQWDRLRVEALLPEYGRDYDGNDNPHEASLERRAVCWTKGCYLGQEAVCMQDMRGKVKRRIVRVRGGGGTLPPEGAAVIGPEGSVGRLGTVVGEGLGWAALALLKTSALAAPLSVEGEVVHVEAPEAG